jgi:hypothetical protein
MKQILSEEFRRMQKLAGIINEDKNTDAEERLSNFGPKNNANQELATQIVKNTVSPESDLYNSVNKDSIEFKYGPDEEGTYYLEFKLEFGLNDLGGYTGKDAEKKFEKELQSAIGGSTSGGPGQSFRKTTVTYEGKENEKHIFSVSIRGGYDI